MLVCSLPVKSNDRLARDVFYTLPHTLGMFLTSFSSWRIYLDTLPQVRALFWTSLIDSWAQWQYSLWSLRDLKIFCRTREIKWKTAFHSNIYVSYLSIGMESNTHAHTPQGERQTDRQTENLMYKVPFLSIGSWQCSPCNFIFQVWRRNESGWRVHPHPRKRWVSSVSIYAYSSYWYSIKWTKQKFTTWARVCSVHRII